jgi:carnitine O-acetyltransferase
MNSQEFAHALELVEAFAGSAGQKLDLLLRAKASQTKNWLTHDWWTQEAYLKSRSPLVINSNPAMIYPQFPFEVNNQRKLIGTLSQLVSGIIDFKLALLQGYNPEWAGGGGTQTAASGHGQYQLDAHLCYNQYRHIFGSTRMPGEQIDSIHFRPLNDDLNDSDVALASNKFNLILSHRGQFFEIQLSNIGRDHEHERIETLESCLSKILDYSSSAQSTGGVGLLTADKRDRWATSIKLLNPDSLRAIREAHLMVCLDTLPAEPQDKFLAHLSRPPTADNTSSPEYLEALSRQVLHSDRTNVGNRWFDKSLQLIVVTDEQSQRFLGAGINYEHSVAEAVVVTKLIEYSYAKTVEQARRRADELATGVDMHATDQDHDQQQKTAAARYRHLKLVNEQNMDEVASVMTQAKQDFVSQLDQFDLAYFNYSSYGANSIKSWRFSPDSWFQVGLQLAHYQLHKRLGPCYESASTRQFAYGRTETIRSLTKDVAEFCQEPTLETMKAAIVSHKSYANAANNASAIDRVLLGYRLIFNELKANNWAWGVPMFDQSSSSSSNGGPRGSHQLRFHSLADTKCDQQSVNLENLFTEQELNVLSAFFNNELIERSKKFSLSTSQVSSAHADICMSYGPLLADGYGCCYNISGQQIVAAITANSSNQSFSCEVNKFSERLREALDRMRDIVVESQAAAAATAAQRSSKSAT